MSGATSAFAPVEKSPGTLSEVFASFIKKFVDYEKKYLIRLVMEKLSYYTESGLQRLKEELRTLKTKGRARVAEQLAEARDKGDLSENAEYDAAKDAQGLLEMKIKELEQAVANARVLSTAEINTSQVSILSTVKIRHMQQGSVLTYTIVAEQEADLKAGKISVDSPIGKGLLGKQVGDVAAIDVPSGKLTFEVLEISI